MGHPRKKSDSAAQTKNLSNIKSICLEIENHINSISKTEIIEETFKRLLKETKLIIWDMDETFWSGTLKEGTLKYSEKNHELLIKLAKSGIINSICSNNNESEVFQVLEKNKIFDYFVFPIINWESKGKSIKTIIENCQLRSKNVLFIDDNARIRNEVEFFNPGIATLDPQVFYQLKQTIINEKDPNLERLKQYKHLEKRNSIKIAHNKSNDDFLKESDIQIQYVTPDESHLERISELINRTNQLNFTKNRSPIDEIKKLISDKSIFSKVIYVKDKYGDYGLSGFVSIANNKAIHFVFSCRIMNMGIEQFVYTNLNSPGLEIVGEVSSNLFGKSPIDWIKLSEYNSDKITNNENNKNARQMLIKGGCDLGSIRSILSGNRNINAILEGQKNTKNGFINLHIDHIEYLKLSQNIKKLDEYQEILQKLPWFELNHIETNFFSGNNRVIIYSLLQSFGCGLYKHKYSDLIIPLDLYYCNLIDKEYWKTAMTNFSLKDRYSSFGFTEDFFKWFSENFEFLGPMGPNRFRDSLESILEKISTNTTVILLNGAEHCPEIQEQPFNKIHIEQHKILNRELDLIIGNHSNLRLIDIRTLVNSESDIADRIYHYKRHIYIEIAQSVVTILNEENLISKPTKIENIFYAFLNAFNYLPKYLKRSIRFRTPPYIYSKLRFIKKRIKDFMKILK